MKKILLFFVVILSATIEAQTYKPHSVNNAINNPTNPLYLACYDKLYSDFLEKYIGNFVIPSYSPEGINEIVIQFFKTEKYMGQNVRQKDPCRELVATYKNSVLQSFIVDEHYIYVVENFGKIVCYEQYTGRERLNEDSNLEVLNIGGRRRYFTEKFRYKYAHLFDIYGYDSYSSVSNSSVYAIAIYDINTSEVSDRVKRKYERISNMHWYNHYGRFIKYLAENDVLEYYKARDFKEKVVLNAYGINANFDFDKYNSFGEIQIKYILK
ncbi:MAG: hypothetical protein IKL50_00015 [Bacteroidales bacterium]|nr:hypothetical protein [Bacteroidales bacterium]